ncbi:hypothetical protein [Glaciimonas sp. Gout2]|uniref:hypothetical protein n=1 Tax=Glaciimonas sp. Gout2 TaxID=3048625 RepID=UPI003A598E64
MTSIVCGVLAVVALEAGAVEGAGAVSEVVGEAMTGGLDGLAAGFCAHALDVTLNSIATMIEASCSLLE